MQINEIVTRKTTERINGTKRWFFEKKKKNDTPLAELRKRKTQVSKIRKERGDIATDYRNIDL